MRKKAQLHCLRPRTFLPYNAERDASYISKCGNFVCIGWTTAVVYTTAPPSFVALIDQFSLGGGCNNLDLPSTPHQKVYASRRRRNSGHRGRPLYARDLEQVSSPQDFPKIHFGISTRTTLLSPSRSTLSTPQR